jgi:hypothetical protein
MQYWLETLPQAQFFRTHRSFIVNMEHVSDFDHSLVYMDVLTEMVVFGIINFYFPDNIPSLTNTTAHFVLVLFSKPLYLFIVQMIAQVLHNKQQASQSFVKSDFLLFPIPLISICITLAFTYCNKINWLIFICASGLLLLNLLVFDINQYNQKRQQQYTHMQLLCQKESDMAEYYRTLVQQDENQRVLIHDIRVKGNLLRFALICITAQNSIEQRNITALQ